MQATFSSSLPGKLFLFREELRREKKLAASKETKQSSSFKSAGWPQRKAKLIQLHKQVILKAIVRCKAVKVAALKPALFISIYYHFRSCVVSRRYSPCDGPIPVQVILPATEIFTVSLLIINRNRLDSSAVG